MGNTPSLTSKKCRPCEGIGNPLALGQTNAFLKETPGWQLSANGKMLSREWITKNFMTAVEFINKIAQMAESENHHPDIHLSSYRRLRVDLSTHALGGLSENDFIVAAKINELPVELKK